MPAGTSLERTAAALHEMGGYLATVPEVGDYQAYAGTSAPINFNGLVRQYYLRRGSDVGDLQVNLVDKRASQRPEPRHRDARAPGASRDRRRAMARSQGGRSAARAAGAGADRRRDLRAGRRRPPRGREGGASRVPQAGGRRRRRRQQRSPTRRAGRRVDREGGAARRARRTSSRRCGRGSPARTSPICTTRRSIRRRSPAAARRAHGDLDALLQLTVRSAAGKVVPLREVVTVDRQRCASSRVYHKDLLPVEYVVGDMAGAVDSPLYGMFGDARRRPRARRRRAAARWPSTSSASRDDPYRGYAHQVGRRVADHLRDVPRHGRSRTRSAWCSSTCWSSRSSART